MPGIGQSATGTAEFDLLCALTGPRRDLPGASLILRQGLDFARVLDLATQHAVRPNLIDGLRQLDWLGVPAAGRERLETFRQSHLVRTLTLAEELCRLSEKFGTARVPFVAFKGATLAASLYGELAAREFTDIDILVPADRLADAELALTELGYRGAQGDRAFRHAFLAHLGQFAFERDDPDAVIDLHWSFFGDHLPAPVTPEEVWRDQEPVVVGRLPIPAPAGRWRALLLASHGTKESWRYLNWIVDFAMLIEHDRRLDWAGIHAVAHARGCGDAVLLGCTLAEGLLKVPIPSVLAAPLARASAVPSRAQSIMAELRAAAPAVASRPNFADLDLWDGRSDRLKAKLRLIFTRSTGDYLAMPLPRPLWGLYHLTRPFRLAARLLRGA